MNNGPNIPLSIGDESVFDIFHRIFKREEFEKIDNMERIKKRVLSSLNISLDDTKSPGYLIEDEINKYRNYTNPYNSGKTPKSMQDFIKKCENLAFTFPIIKNILKDSKNYSINELLKAIDDIENQGNYSTDGILKNQIENIKSSVYEAISDYKLCYDRYRKKLALQLDKHKVNYFPYTNVRDEFEQGMGYKKVFDSTGYKSPGVVIRSEYDFSTYTPNKGLEFFEISTNPEEILERQKIIGELLELVDDDILNFLGVFGFINDIDFGGLLGSNTLDWDWNGHLVAAYYGPGGNREQEVHDTLFTDKLSRLRKGSYKYYEKMNEHIMETLNQICQVPEKLRKITTKLKNIPKLKDYAIDLEKALQESEYFFSMRSFTDGNPFFDVWKFVQEKKKQKDLEKKDKVETENEKLRRLMGFDNDDVDDKGFINNGESIGELATRYNAHLGIIDQFLKRLWKVTNLLRIAYHIKSNEWQKIDLNTQKETQYTNGWHPAKQKTGHKLGEGNKLKFEPIDRNQILNHSPDNTPLIAYSGPNTSGKTFSGLQRDFIIKTSMQSFGYASVEDGNIGEFFDLIVYMDRATTNARSGKSAYMEEVSRIKIIFDQSVGKKILFYIDEPFSTTSPIDQSGMIELLVNYIHSRGGKCIIATHNEVFLNSQIGNPNTSLYYFPIINGVKTRLLTPGIGTSDFFSVARNEGFREDIIADAQKYDEGKLSIDFGLVSNLKFNSGEGNNIGNLFPNLGEGHNPLLGLYSKDPNFDFVNGIGTFRFDESFYSLDNVIIKRLLSKMIFNAPILTGEAILERQKLFGGLLKNNSYQEITKLCSYLVEIEDTFSELKGGNINQKLCPIKGGIKESEKLKWILNIFSELGELGADKISLMIKYLGFNKILFGELPENASLFMKKLKDLRKNLKEFGEIIDKQRKDFLERNKADKDIEEEKTYYTLSNFLTEIFGLKEESDSEYEEKTLRMFIKAIKGESLEEEKTFDKNTTFLIQELYKKLSSNTDIVSTKEMINFITTYLENILQECLEIPKTLPEIKLNNPKLSQKSFFLRIFDTKELFGSEKSEECEEKDQFEAMKNRTYRAKRASSFGGVFSKMGTKGNIARVLLSLIQAKKDYGELRKKLGALNNPITNEIILELDKSFNKMWNEEGIDTTDSKEKDKRTGKSHLGRGLEGHEFIGETTRMFHNFGNWGEEKKEITRGLFTNSIYQIASFCAFSAIIKHHNLTPATIVDNGIFNLDNAGNIFEDSKTDHKNSLILGENNQIGMILTGPNGSGKTYYGKSVIINTQLALSTGWTYDDNSVIPKFEKIIYLDRVVEVGNERSSGALELDYWSEVLEIVEHTSGPILFFADEIFSTTSPKYQGAFMASVVKRLIEKGAYFIISNHHGDVTKWLIENAPERVLPYHFGFTITPEKTIVYHRNLLPGIEKSYAKEVAKTMGLFDDSIELNYIPDETGGDTEEELLGNLDYDDEY